MKKFQIALLSLATFFLMSFTINADVALHAKSSAFTEIAVGFTPITVYKVTIVGRNGTASTQTLQAEFDKEKMELRIIEKRNGKNYTMTYSVVRNPYKGYSDDPRGRYEFNSAGCYYF